MANKLLLGVDTGGTFTDFVLLRNEDVRVHKVLSTPEAPSRAILTGIKDLGLVESLEAGDLAIIHGSTVATNAVLEGKGVSTVYITNSGLGDVLTIGRQTRRDLYNLTPAAQPVPVASTHIIETGGRVDAKGNTIVPLTGADLDAIIARVDQLAPRSVAINLLFSFLDDSWEKQIEQVLQDRYFVSRSSIVLPEYKEYERGIATWLNAWLGPIMHQYLDSLCQSIAPSTLAIMQSSGRTMAAGGAADKAVHLLLSGPAAGLSGAIHMGSINRQLQLMSFDMGGTSTDVSLLDGSIKLTSEGAIGPYPVAVPMADIHTIGSGGGSIAFMDAGGLLQVGPESAGATPGPACYGLGGVLPTVTDANVVLGRLRPEAFLGGRMVLDVPAARKSLSALASAMDFSIEETAEGVINLANEKMIQALRFISVQRGYDPKQFRLACFGGAGGLHFCDLAEALEIKYALVPLFGGVLSAFGMLVAPPGRELSLTHQCLLANADPYELNRIVDTLSDQGIDELRYEGIDPAKIQVVPSLDIRYAGQSYTLNVPWTDITKVSSAFHQAHALRYGHRLERPLELVNLRVGLSAQASEIRLPQLLAGSQPEPASRHKMYGFDQPVNIFERKSLRRNSLIEGPALITETVATTLINEGWSAAVDDVGNILLENGAAIT